MDDESGDMECGPNSPAARIATLTGELQEERAKVERMIDTTLSRLSGYESDLAMLRQTVISLRAENRKLLESTQKRD